MTRGSLLLIVFLVLLASCKSSKSASASIPNLSAKKITKKNSEVEFDEKSIKANLSIKYSGKSEFPNLKASVRILKDSVIWVSVSKFSIPLAKLLITKSEIRFYEKISRSYFVGDFELIKEWLGIKFDFNQVQNLFIGEALINLGEDKFVATVKDNMYSLKAITADPKYNIVFWINPNNFKLEKEEIVSLLGDQSLIIDYKEYEVIEGSLFPKGFTIDAWDENSETNIDINFRNVIFNSSLRFPFKIPNGYEEIELK